MKKFRFKYDKVLQVRIEKENEVRNNLGKINQLIMEAERQLDVISQQYHNFLVDIDDMIKKGVKASDMQAIAHNKSYLTSKIEEIKKELKVLYSERKSIQAELIEANKQRKVMEKLREKELEEYKMLEAQEEAKIVDQIVTYQSTKTRGE